VVDHRATRGWRRAIGRGATRSVNSTGTFGRCENCPVKG
jgi:hypothetical protein